MGATAKYLLLPLAGPLVADTFDSLLSTSNVQALQAVNLTARQLDPQGVLRLLSNKDFIARANSRKQPSSNDTNARAVLYALASLYEDGFKV